MSEPVAPQNAIVVVHPPQKKQEAYPNLYAGPWGNDGGRPTKYDVKYAEMLVKFFQQDRYVKYIKAEKVITKKDGTQEKFYDYAYMPNDLPTLDKFARSIGVDGATLVRWANDKYPEDHQEVEKRGQLKRPKFRAAYNEAKILQKEFLMDNGLRGMYNPSAFIFVARNLTDMKDKTDGEPADQRLLPTPIYGGKSTNI